MNKVKNRKHNKVLNNRGSAIIMALVVMTILVTLGLAVMTLSSGTLNSNVADASNNDAYYAAEAGVNSAIEQVKYEASKYYAKMLDAQGTDLTDLYNNFHTEINSEARDNFNKPGFSDVTTETSFELGEYDSDQSTCEFLVSCTATTADDTSYVVTGSVLVKKVDVSSGSGRKWFEPDLEAAIQAGGTLDIGSSGGAGANNGDILISALNVQCSWQCRANNGELIITPSAGDTLNDTLEYLSYSDPVVDNPNPFITTNNYVINWGNVPDEPVSILGTPGNDIRITSCTVPDGVIHGKGNMIIENCNVYADIYVDGDLHVNSCGIYGDIYVRGDFNGNNANLQGGITCDGFVDYYSGYVKKPIYSGEGIDIRHASTSGSLFSAGDITIDSVGVSDGIVYSKSKVSIGNCGASAIVFSGGDIDITGSMSINGCILAKNNINYVGCNTWLNVGYSRCLIDNILKDPEHEFFDFESQAGGELQLDKTVFVNQSVTAQGRVN